MYSQSPKKKLLRLFFRLRLYILQKFSKSQGKLDITVPRGDGVTLNMF